MDNTTIAIIVGVSILTLVIIGLIIYFVFFRIKPTPHSNSPLSQIMINGYLGAQKTILVCTNCGFQNNPVDVTITINITSVDDDIGPSKDNILRIFKNYTTKATMGQGTDIQGNNTTIFLIDTPTQLSSLHHNSANIMGTYLIKN